MTAGLRAAAAGLFALLSGCGGDAPAALAPDFATPESVLFDPEQDCWIVSNIHGAPLAKDDNGFLVKVSPVDGSRTAFVDGRDDGVTLHAPKGMALVGDVLWVADIDVLRKFDRRSGAALGEVEVPGATFLNDVSAGPDGTVYCSDSGLDASFAPTGTDAIWRIPPDGEPSPLLRTTELGQPNGIDAQPGGVFVVSWRDGTFAQVDYQGHRTELGRAPQAQLDGLVRVELTGDNGRSQPVWFATSWQGSTIYRFDFSGTAKALPVRLEQPADLCWDPVRAALVVPLFGENRLHVESL